MEKRKSKPKDFAAGTVIAERLRILMAEKHLTQEEMAEKTGLSQQTISKYLSGKPPKMSNLSLLAGANGVSESYFLDASAAMESSIEKSLRAITLARNLDREMKVEIRKLMERIKRKATTPAAKKELAEYVGVALPRIYEWLSFKKEPSGEYTLRLLNWVEGKT
jgi:transcriptional regulator with XRE-family HTH domain